MISAAPRTVVIGSTGMLGAPVTHELVAAGIPVTAVVRDRNAVLISRRLPSQAEVVAGDVRDPVGLAKAFRGHEVVYVSLGVASSARSSEWWVESEGIKNILSAAREAGIQRIAYLSSLLQRYEGFRWWVFDMKREALSLLRASGIPSTLFFPSNFIESLPHRMLRGRRIALAGRAKEKAYWIAARDYGRQVATALKLPGTESREYVVQGPEPLTVREAAQEFVRHYAGEKLGVAGAPLAIFKLLGQFSPTFDYVWHISDAVNNAPEPFQAETTWRELGKPETTVAKFAAAFEPLKAAEPKPLSGQRALGASERS